MTKRLRPAIFWGLLLPLINAIIVLGFNLWVFLGHATVPWEVNLWFYRLEWPVSAALNNHADQVVAIPIAGVFEAGGFGYLPSLIGTIVLTESLLAGFQYFALGVLLGTAIEKRRERAGKFSTVGGRRSQESARGSRRSE